jgi:hypothetical protein
MLRLQSFPHKEPPNIQKLRRAAAAAPRDYDAQIAFALALSRAGCTYEAATILRPLRVHWKSHEGSQFAKHAIDAQSWWNQNWRTFAQLRQSGRNVAALALLDERATHYWDLPSLLMHLGEIAADDGQLDLASHLFQRVSNLSERGLPKMNMAAFAYVSQAALVDVLAKQGDAVAALAQHRAITPNPGNAMGHQIQQAKLLVAVGHLDEAMRTVASILVTATKHRTGYSKDMRMEFVKSSPHLAPLRRRVDWKAVLRDPDTYLREAGK